MYLLGMGRHVRSPTGVSTGVLPGWGPALAATKTVERPTSNFGNRRHQLLIREHSLLRVLGAFPRHELLQCKGAPGASEGLQKLCQTLQLIRLCGFKVLRCFEFWG